MRDIFVYDRIEGTIALASLSGSGEQGNNHSSCPAISADGRFVAFESSASNLVEGDTNGYCDVFVRNLSVGTTEMVSVAADGTQGNGSSSSDDSGPAISSDGRVVAFVSRAENLDVGDTNSRDDVFVFDRLAGFVEPDVTAPVLSSTDTREIIIADEPTGNLDHEIETAILSILTSLARNDGKCVIIVTHSKRVTSIADEVWGINDGKLLFVKRVDGQ